MVRINCRKLASSEGRAAPRKATQEYASIVRREQALIPANEGVKSDSADKKKFVRRPSEANSALIVSGASSGFECL
jgi:hypothetical protein